MRKNDLARVDDVTPPIGMRGGARGLAVRPADPRWLAALVLMAGLAGVLMALPLSRLSDGRVLVPPAVAPTAGPARGDAIVGVRGDPIGFADGLAPPGLFERRLEHLRLDRSGLRAYVFALAKPAYARGPAPTGAEPDDDPPAPSVPRRPDARRPVPLGVPIDVTAVARTAVVADRRTAVVLQREDSLAAVLSAMGMRAERAAEAAALLADRVGAHGGSPAAGDVVEAVLPAGDDAATAGFSRVSVVRGGVGLGAVARRDDGGNAPVVADDGRTGAAKAGAPSVGLDDSGGPGRVRGPSLREGLRILAGRGGLPAAVVDDVLRICAKDVDLGAPAGPDDAVAILYSPETSEGRPLPEVAFVSVAAEGRTRSFYRYAGDAAALADYYDDGGRSASRLLLRKPVAAGRLGDGFGWRIHPVLKDRRFHEGVDYAAPFGSPIVAAGAGVVERIDEQWGYGKYVRILHDQGYETTYAHVAGAAPGLRVGARVSQGDVIAFVGSTGLSTGPHLYYEVRINGRDVDPLRVRLAAGAVLQGDALASFRTRKRRVDMLVDDARGGEGVRVAGASP